MLGRSLLGVLDELIHDARFVFRFVLWLSGRLFGTIHIRCRLLLGLIEVNGLTGACLTRDRLLSGPTQLAGFLDQRRMPWKSGNDVADFL